MEAVGGKGRNRIKRYNEKGYDFGVWLSRDGTGARNNSNSEVQYLCYWKNNNTPDNVLGSMQASTARRQCEWFMLSITAGKEIVPSVTVREC